MAEGRALSDALLEKQNVEVHSRKFDIFPLGKVLKVISMENKGKEMIREREGERGFKRNQEE